MAARAYIDNKDIYTEYGMYALQGAYNELVCMPSLKKVNSNDWQEEDGVEADLESPQLDTKSVSLKFGITSQRGYKTFITALSNGSYHLFNFSEIGHNYRLRLTGMGSINIVGDLYVVSLKFTDDFPLNGYTYQAPTGNPITTTGDILLDGRALECYGVTPLYGTLEELEKMPEVKQNLLRNIEAKSGAIYDPLNVTYKSKDTKLSLLMRAASLSEFWQNYNAFLYDLIRPQERRLYAKQTDTTYSCYYKSCNVTEFVPKAGKIWFKFGLTMVFTNFRIS